MSLYLALQRTYRQPPRIVTKAEIRIPMLGIWEGEVDVQDPAVATGACTLVLAGLTLRGTIRRAAAWHGVFRAKVVGGADGWAKQIDSAGYHALTGVKASTLARDAARAVGETVEVAEDFTVGNSYARERCPASRVLGWLDRPWFMRPDGVTVIGPRPAGVVASSFEVIDGAPETGIYTVATEHPEDFVPGRTFASATIPSTTIRGVVHRVDGGHLRTEIWAP